MEWIQGLRPAMPTDERSGDRAQGVVAPSLATFPATAGAVSD